MTDLFTKPPFDPDQYIIERERCLIEKYPQNKERYQALIDYIEQLHRNGKTYCKLK